MNKYIILTVMLNSGCSSNRVLIQPQAVYDQAVVHDRGAYSLHSQSPHKLKIAVLDYSYDEIIINLSTTNTSSKPILFSEKTLKLNCLLQKNCNPRLSIAMNN